VIDSKALGAVEAPVLEELSEEVEVAEAGQENQRTGVGAQLQLQVGPRLPGGGQEIVAVRYFQSRHRASAATLAFGAACSPLALSSDRGYPAKVSTSPGREPRPGGSLTPSSHYSRYVALGDSSTEGLDDPDGRGGYRGWADRLAGKLAAAQGAVLYANFGVRGKKTRDIREEQLPCALELSPDLVTLFSGTNDVIGRRFDAAGFHADVEHMQGELRGIGATVLTFTLPDLGPVLPLAKRFAPRLEEMNDILRDVSERTGTILVDLATYPVASDPRLWSEDRLHANSAGHERMATALAHAAGIEGADASWQRDLEPSPPRSLPRRLAAEWSWTTRHLAPWLWRHLRGRSSGDGITCKQPELIQLRS
jgi:lysophospholipase L1-like esterase